MKLCVDGPLIDPASLGLNCYATFAAGGSGLIQQSFAWDSELTYAVHQRSDTHDNSSCCNLFMDVAMIVTVRLCL
jgi:hypothetical protein